jgi:hypothetical protein
MDSGVHLPGNDAGSTDATVDQTSPPATDSGTDSAQPAKDSGVVDSGAVDSSLADTGIDAPVDSGVPTPPPDFVWYVLDETSGTVAHDSSSNHYDIDLTGVTWNVGANFDGTGGGGVTTVGPSYRVPPITITAWLTPAARTDGDLPGEALQPYPPNALSDDVPGVGGYGVGLNVWSSGSALAAEGVDTCTQAGLCAASETQNAADAGFSCTSATDCQQGFLAATEYFVVVAIAPEADGGPTPTATVYVNGAVFDQTTAYIPAPNASPPLYLGMHNEDTGYGTKRFFDGRIRDVRVYQRALDVAEVGQLFTNGPVLHAPPQPDAGPQDASTD